MSVTRRDPVTGAVYVSGGLIGNRTIDDWRSDDEAFQQTLERRAELLHPHPTFAQRMARERRQNGYSPRSSPVGCARSHDAHRHDRQRRHLHVHAVRHPPSVNHAATCWWRSRTSRSWIRSVGSNVFGGGLTHEGERRVHRTSVSVRVVGPVRGKWMAVLSVSCSPSAHSARFHTSYVLVLMRGGHRCGRRGRLEVFRPRRLATTLT